MIFIRQRTILFSVGFLCVAFISRISSMEITMQPDSLKNLCLRAVGKKLRTLYTSCENLEEYEQKISGVIELLPLERQEELSEELSGYIRYQNPSKRVGQAHPYFYPKHLKSVKFNDSGTHCALFTLNGFLYSLAKKKAIARIASLGDVCAGFDFSKDNKYFIGISGDRIQIWDLEQDELYFEASLGIDIRRVQFDLDGKQALSASDDNTARIWSLQNKQMLGSLHHPECVNSAIFLQNAIVTACLDNLIRVWDRDNFTCMKTLELPGECSLTVGPLRNVIVVTELLRGVLYPEQRQIKIFDSESLSWKHEFLFNPLDCIYDIKLNAQETYLLFFEFRRNSVQDAGTSNDRFARAGLWDLSKGEFVRFFEVKQFNGDVESAVEFTPDGKNVVIGNAAGVIQFIDLETNNVIKEYDAFAFARPDYRDLNSYDSEYFDKIQINYTKDARYLFYFGPACSWHYVIDLAGKNFVSRKEYYDTRFVIVFPQGENIICIMPECMVVIDFSGPRSIKENLLCVLMNRLRKGKKLFLDEKASKEDIERQSEDVLESTFLKELPEDKRVKMTEEIFETRQKFGLTGIKNFAKKHLWYLPFTRKLPTNTGIFCTQVGIVVFCYKFSPPYKVTLGLHALSLALLYFSYKNLK